MAAISLSTIMFVLALMNLSGMVIAAAYLPVALERRLLAIFALNRLVHGASWFFRFLDSVSGVAWYRPVADILFVVGCAVEGGIYLGFMRPWRFRSLLVHGLVALALSALALWPLFGSAMAGSFQLIAAMTVFMWWPAIRMLRPPMSTFRASLALSLILVPIILAVAAWMSLDDLIFMYINPTPWGITLLAAVFMLQMLLVFGFQLLSKERNEEKLKILADTDSMTGISNRRAFFQRIELFVQRRQGTSTEVSIILMDLDLFKQINDTYGHDTGDRVIQHFTATVQGAIRDKDVFARFGGEEFIAFLPDTGRKEAELVARRIHERLRENRHRVADDLPPYTVSLGICTGRMGNQADLVRLLSLSDEALYHSKKNGRDCSSWTSPDLKSIESST